MCPQGRRRRECLGRRGALALLTRAGVGVDVGRDTAFLTDAQAAAVTAAYPRLAVATTLADEIPAQARVNPEKAPRYSVAADLLRERAERGSTTMEDAAAQSRWGSQQHLLVVSTPGARQYALVTDVLVVDLDGVLRVWDAHIIGTAEERHSLPPGAINAAAFEPALLEEAITGRITDARWRAEVTTNLQRQWGVDAAMAVAEWSDSCGRIDATVLSLLRRQREQRQVVLLTNATTRLHADLAVLGVAEEFDGIFSSAELGVAKPDVRVFTAVCSRLDVAATRCAFVDDSPANVRSAVALGMEGHVYGGPQQLAAFLRGLPPPGG